MDLSNMLFYGDNYDVLRYLIDSGYSGTIDLVYIDPPFASKNVFTVGNNRVSTISRIKQGNVAYVDNLVGDDFLEFLRGRLILIRELLSDIGSIYLHIDNKMGHYVKVLMDEIFGIDNFRNDITRIKCNPKNFNRKAYGNIKDTILFYSKTDKLIWNDPREPLEEEEIVKRFKKRDKNGRRYTTIPIYAPGETLNGVTGQEWKGMKPPIGRHWRKSPEELTLLDEQGLIEWSKTGNPRKIIYADECSENGKKVQDIWEYKDPQNPKYPTQKNQKMLERIILASSNANSLVMDCFCGSGSFLVAADRLGRHWIGVDNSPEAIKVVEKQFGSDEGLFVKGYRKYVF